MGFWPVYRRLYYTCVTASTKYVFIGGFHQHIIFIMKMRLFLSCLYVCAFTVTHKRTTKSRSRFHSSTISLHVINQLLALHRL